jgi:hypothetical protein
LIERLFAPFEDGGEGGQPTVYELRRSDAVRPYAIWSDWALLDTGIDAGNALDRLIPRLVVALSLPHIRTSLCTRASSPTAA